MAQELIYTSAERGLRAGTRGFCTVAHTRGMSPQVIQLLEALSAYKGVRSPGENGGELVEPVAFSHLTSNLFGRNTSIISRIGATHPDHTGRSNKLAHHIVLQSHERTENGPAWLCAQPDFLLEEWKDVPHLIEEQRTVPDSDVPLSPAERWADITGDAANAAILPEMYIANPDGIVLIQYLPGMDLLPLLVESLRLLPVSLRWKVTFNTFFTTLPAGSNCNWRCCIAGTEAVREVKRNPKAVLLDLTGYELKTPSGAMAEIARTGRAPEKAQTINMRENTQQSQKFVLMDNRNINMLTLKPRKNN